MEVTTESICIDYLADFSDKKNNDLKASYYENYIFSVTGVMARGLVSPTAVILGKSISKKGFIQLLENDLQQPVLHVKSNAENLQATYTNSLTDHATGSVSL